MHGYAMMRGTDWDMLMCARDENVLDDGEGGFSRIDAISGGAFGRRWEVLLLYEGRIMYIALAPINYCKCIR